MNVLKKAIFAALVAVSPVAVGAANAATTITDKTLAEFWKSLGADWGLGNIGSYSGTKTVVGSNPKADSGPSSPFALTTSIVYSWTLNITADTSVAGLITYFASGAQVKWTEYGQTLNGVAFGSTTVTPAQANASLNESYAKAVPGPVVAAGLPGLLGLVGFAALRRRRIAA